MKVIVIGGGLAGVTSAWLLRARGHELTVLEREQGPGQQASFANGGMLTPGMCEPWNAPGVWRVLLGSVGRSDAALQLRLPALPSLVRWGMMFLRNSTAVAFERNHRSNVQLAMYSLAVMRTLREHAQIDYGCAARGSLGIFRDRAALDRAANEANRLSAAGLQCRRLTTAESVHIEPALAPIADRLSGALLYESDEVGDAHQYCVSLAERARAAGVQFRFGVEASLEMRNGRLSGVIADGECLVADRYVVAAGSYSTLLLRRAGVRLPVRPVKGYSITFDSDGQPQRRNRRRFASSAGEVTTFPLSVLYPGMQPSSFTTATISLIRGRGALVRTAVLASAICISIVPLIEHSFGLTEAEFYRRENEETQKPRFDCSRTHAALHSMGIVAPRLNDGLLRACVERMMERRAGT